MPESGQVSVCLLYGRRDDSAAEGVYIGQTGNLRKRLPAHDKEKDF